MNLGYVTLSSDGNFTNCRRVMIPNIATNNIFRFCACKHTFYRLSTGYTLWSLIRDVTKYDV